MRTNGFTKRLIALLLSTVMVFSLLPAMQTTAATVSGSKVADANTMDSWKTFFSPENITTAHAGGVWTDKSVFSDASAFQSLGVTLDSDNNFLVALSALASNSVVVGQTYAPTDTMFVLDVSNSMSNTALSNMVTATNNAIRTLLEGEGNTNRVGVVLYGTTASVLLPLDHYTGVTVNGVENFIELSNGAIRTARLRISGSNSTAPDWWDEDRWGPYPDNWWSGSDDSSGEMEYLKNSAGDYVTTSVSTGGGTYIQGGLWKAWQEFANASVDTSSAIKRAPTMVLMSDGAPTYSASDFDNVPNSSNWGTGSDSYTGDGFVTQLTAAYIKASMAEKYGTKAYFYTLGLDVADIDIAKAVLDPANSQTNDLSELWEDYLDLQNGATISVSMRRDNRSSNVNIDKVAKITDANYSDRYFSAAQASDLNLQFQNIVNEISLSAGYYPTHLDDNGSNYSGYITFVDEIGRGMDVKHVKGIVIGSTIYTGEMLARSLNAGVLGTKNAPTAMGEEFVQSVKARLGLTDNEEVWNLLDYSYNTRKSLHYDAATGKWSNYIVWYGDANGDYLGYNEALEDTAVFRNECYGMLGSASGSSKISDMMYVGIQVSTNLKTGDQIVTFRIPASMLPVVTYQININGNEVTESTTASLSYIPADPIRLLYEVGINENVNPRNVTDFAQEIGGKFYLYTNKWSGAQNIEDPANNSLSYAYFEPGTDNEHYYFTDDAVVYSAENVNSAVNKNVSLNPNGTYFYRHYIFVGDMSTKSVNAETGAITVSARTDFHFEKLSAAAIEAASNAAANSSETTHIVPEGTMHYAHSHNLQKDLESTSAVNENYTETFGYVRYQIVDAVMDNRATGAHHYELMYLGNNGRLEVEPTQGILLKKQMSDSTANNATFTFDVKLETNESQTPVKLVYVDADGNESDPEDATVVNERLQVQLKAGESVYIYDIPAGTDYTVTELEHDTYHQKEAVNATGRVLDDVFSVVIITNEKTTFSELNVSKYVTYEKGASADNEASKTFTVTVKLTRPDGTAYAGKTVTVKGEEMQTNAAGEVSFDITDKDTVKIGNIPVNIQYAVTESNLPVGYSWANSNVDAELKGTITVAGANAVLHNTYTPADLTVGNISLTVKKTLKNAASELLTSWPEDFTFNVFRWDRANRTWGNAILTYVLNDQAHRDDGHSGSIPAQVFTEAGTYYFRVEEALGTRPGMTYDRTFHDFAVTVADADLDGSLELVSVTDVQNTQVSQTNNGWNVLTNFTNTYQANSTKLAFTGIKQLLGAQGTTRKLQDGEFTFELYKTGSDFDITAQNAECIQTVVNGIGGNIAFNAITYAEANTYYYVVKEHIPADGDKLGGVEYSTQVYNIAVTVSDVGGSLSVTNVVVNGEDKTATVTENVLSGLDFTNTYTVDSVDVPLNIVKHFVGRDTSAQKEFQFVVIDPADNNKVIKTLSTEGKWTGNDAAISFTLDDIASAGVHEYVIKEVIPDNAAGNVYQGVTYDATEYHVIITVTDNGDGTLSSVVTMNGLGTNTARFTNVYAAASATGVVLNGNKTLNGAAGTNRPLKEGEFSFTLTGNGVHETVTNQADGSFSFSALTFNTVGDYTFTIAENNTYLGGVTYVEQPVTVTVHVADNGAGQLVATIDGEPVSEYVAQFENTYAAQEAQLKLEGFKELIAAEGTDRQLKIGEFSFTLEDVNHEFTYIDPVTGERATGKKLTVTNGVGDDARKIQFPTIFYNAVGTHTYSITEVKNSDGTNGIVYDKVTYIVSVEVTDNGSGQLQAKVTKVEAKTGTDSAHVKHVIDFFNSYYAESVSVTLAGNKVLENVTPGIAQTDKLIPLTGTNLIKFPFNFQLEAVTEGAPMPNAAGAEGCIVQSGANGAIVFPEIIFDSVGEYVYTVKEVIPADSVNGVLNGVTYSLQTHEITVKVTDNQFGQLEAKVLVGDTEKTVDDNGKVADALSFKNTYKAAETEFIFNGTKTLEGRDLMQGEFSFLLKDADGQVLQTVVNKDGKFTFAAETFSSVGSYQFVIVEDTSAEKAGITFDKTQHTITIIVKDDGTGQLKTYIGDEEVDHTTVSFTNTFTPDPVTAMITVEKVLENQTKEALGLDGFKFQLAGEDSTLVQSTAKDGFAKFELSFGAEDVGKTFTYQLTEVNTKIPGMVYSEMVYEYKLTVAKDQSTGKLSVSMTRDGKAVDSNAKFVNVYEGVEEPPKTGDDAQPAMMAFVMCCSAAVLAVLLFTSKKTNYRGRYVRN